MGIVKRSGRAARTVVGLDLDPSHVAAAEVTVNGDMRIRRGASRLLRPGILRDGGVAEADALSQAIRELFAEHDLPKRVRVGIADQRIVVRTLEVAPVEAKELAGVVRAQAPDHIPMPMDEAVLDFQPLGVVDTPEGPRTRVVIVAVRREMVEQIAFAVRDAGVQVEGIDLSAFAMVRALGAGAGEGARLYANVAGLTNVAVADGSGVLFSRAAPGGLDTIVHELCQRRSLTAEHSRQWLAHVGLSEPLDGVEGDPDLVAATRSVLDEGVHHLADALRNSLNFYRMQDSALPVEDAVLTGPCLAIPGFAERMGELLGLPVAAGVLAADDGAALQDPERLTLAAGLAVEERG